MKPPISTAVILANVVCLAVAAPTLEQLFSKHFGSDRAREFLSQQRQDRQTEDDQREQAVVVAKETANQTLAIDDFLLSGSVATFTQTLMDRILRSDEHRLKNVVVSPFSIHLCLSMLFYASPEDSGTHTQLARALGLKVADAPNYLANYARALLYYKDISEKHQATVRLANRIFMQESYTVNPQYQQVMQAYLTSVDNSVSFANPSEAERRINEYVSQKTNGLIDELLSPGSVDSLTLMVLVNAIYYKANWLNAFEKRLTRVQDFELIGSTIDQLRTVTHKKMMVHPSIDMRTAFNVPELDGASVLELPYENTDFNMYVALPKENTLTALNRLAVNFQYSKFASKLTGGVKPVMLPGFDINFDVGLNDILKGMGVRDMFDHERANFSDLTEEDVAVSQVAHSAAVKVDEAGSEAAAATAAVLGTRTVNLNRNDFVVDRPFVFMIHDKAHDVPLFFGRILNPANENGDQEYGEREERQPQRQSTVPVEESAEDFETSDDKLAQLEVKAPAAAEDECIDELGYEAVAEPNVSFPCKGRDTIPIEKHEAEEQRHREAQHQDFEAKKGAFQ